MQKIIETINKIRSQTINSEGKYALENFGLFAFSDSIRVKNVSFYEPCLILILSGMKEINLPDGEVIECSKGECLVVSAPSCLNFKNIPDSKTGEYKALALSFDNKILQSLPWNNSSFPRNHVKGGSHQNLILHYPFDNTFLTSIKHYLSTKQGSGDFLLTHRLTEILLILAEKNNKLFQFISNEVDWGQRVRFILLEDISYAWEIKHICERLAVSESKLRRMLQKEEWNFRSILKELRLSTGFMNLVDTNKPISQVAFDSGYESASRFSKNFKERYGLTPSEFRKKKIESG